MVSYNFVFCILSMLLFGAALCISDSDETRAVSHNINDCTNAAANKTLIYSTVINERARFLGYTTKTVSFPSSSVNQDLITCIVVTDNDGDGTGGYPSISSGGLNSYSVEIELTSQWSRGLHFTVRIYTDA
ncbi:uncharacterized protein LOC108740122 [Agrilus planipennis]|uniref:Uncharacterized protein LOC108740122 n=1 Tax=Agrilus planipennis TaxID=224129 RepID=A0A1W4X163_AGRPL|nr:uncharacterized protein LOC108740122 [Agrilus planipennis]